MRLLCLLLSVIVSACSLRPQAQDRDVTRAPAQATIAQREKLWALVNEQCLGPNAKVTQLDSPCAMTSVDKGYLVFRDKKSPTHHLLIPIAKVTGLEDPVLLKSATPNYWQAAWDARTFINAAVGKEVPREKIALAINPVFNRTQDQLHIHMDCLRPDVLAELEKLRGAVAPEWTEKTVTLVGAPYRIRFLRGEELGGTNPFLLLAKDAGNDSAKMGQSTMVLVGARTVDGFPGFYLLERSGPGLPPEGSTDLSLKVHGEDVQDFSCAVIH